MKRQCKTTLRRKQNKETIRERVDKEELQQNHLLIMINSQPKIVG